MPEIEDPTILRLLAKMAYEGGLTPKSETPDTMKNHIVINTLRSNPALPSLYAELQKLGWSITEDISPGSMAANVANKKYYVRIVRMYDEADLYSCKFLYWRGWGGGSIAGYVGRNGARWIADVDYIGRDTGLGWDQRIGDMGAGYSYFVNEEVKDGLMSAGLKGLFFHPLEWNDPSRAQRNFWELDSQFRMPTCLLPVVDLGPSFYCEGAYEPVELRFNKEEVAQMGEFDAAWCREEVGRQDEYSGKHVLVVSQRFRQVITSLGLAELVDYVPVRLV